MLACVGLGAPYPPSCAVIDGCPLKSFFMEPGDRALNISHVDRAGVYTGWCTPGSSSQYMPSGLSSWQSFRKDSLTMCGIPCDAW